MYTIGLARLTLTELHNYEIGLFASHPLPSTSRGVLRNLGLIHCMYEKAQAAVLLYLEYLIAIAIH